MKIAVIAANGRSGKVFVRAALAAGHEIRAGVHSRSTFKPQPNLTIVKCDATNPDELRKLLTGQDAVVSLIGHVKGSEADVQTKATENTISLMRTLDIKRIVSLTGTGVRFPGDKITLIDRFVSYGIKLIDPARVRDGKNHVEALKRCGLDWTVLRVSKLQNTRPRAYSLTLSGPPKLYVARREVAKAILEVLENNTFIGQAPIISPKK